MTLQPIGSVKCAMMLKGSLPYCFRRVRPSYLNQQIDVMMPEQTSEQGASGDGSKVHFLTYGFSTLTQQAKKREYGDRIREVEMASFTPLVFATTGGMGREASAFYRRLADLMAAKNNSTYSTTMAWMRCVLSFSLLRAAVMCIRGSRSSYHHVPDASLELAVAESHLFY